MRRVCSPLLTFPVDPTSSTASPTWLSSSVATTPRLPVTFGSQSWRRRVSRLHVEVQTGRNAHHIVEAQFKSVARALRDAVMLDARVVGVPSTKGTLGT